MHWEEIQETCRHLVAVRVAGARRAGTGGGRCACASYPEGNKKNTFGMIFGDTTSLFYFSSVYSIVLSLIRQFAPVCLSHSPGGYFALKISVLS